MENSENNSSSKMILGGASVAAVAVLGYLFMNSGSKNMANADQKPAEEKTDINKSMNQDNKKSSNDSFSKEQVQEIEKIVLNLIREKNDLFMTTMQEGIQQQQIKSAEEMAKTATMIKEDLAKDSIKVGDDSAPFKVFAFIDPSCPHCHVMVRTAAQVAAKSKNVQFNFVVAAMLDGSEPLTKALYAVRAQSNEKAAAFMQKIIALPRGSSNAQLVLTAKEAGADVTKFEADKSSEGVKTVVERISMVIGKLKVGGFPTVLFQNSDGNLILGQPVSPDEFITLGNRVKAKQDLNKPAEPIKEEETKKEEPKEMKKEEPKKEAAKVASGSEKKADKK